MDGKLREQVLRYLSDAGLKNELLALELINLSTEQNQYDGQTPDPKDVAIEVLQHSIFWLEEAIEELQV